MMANSGVKKTKLANLFLTAVKVWREGWGGIRIGDFTPQIITPLHWKLSITDASSYS